MYLSALEKQMNEVAAAHPLTGHRPAGPKGSVLFGNLAQMRDDPLRLLTDAAREYGHISRLRLVFNVYLLTHPDYIGRVLRGEHSHKYRKGKLYKRIKPLIGEGLLSSEGDHWVRQRKLVQPAFRPRNLDAYADVMHDETARMLERWKSRAETGAVFDVMKDMTDVTLRIIGRTMLGINLASSVDSVLANLPTVLSTLNRRFQQLLYAPFLPTPQNRRFNRALAALEDVVNGVIEERRHAGLKHDDFLSTLITARDEEGNGMTPKQLRDEAMTMLLAGHETTSNTLSWTLHLLATHADIQRHVRDEVSEALSSGPQNAALVKRLPYTRMVIQEAMRLYPPVWLLGRFVAEDDEIDGVRIPKGSVVFLSPYVTQRHPDFWDRPETFDPSRFLPERAEKRPQHSYFPFSAGPRTCIGDRFAMMEAQIILAHILTRYRVLDIPDHAVEPEPSVTLKPRNGVHVRIVAV